MIKEKDDANEAYCIKIRHHFDFRNHICMVFDMLGLSMFDFMKDNLFQPFSIEEVQHFAQQMLIAVQFMHR